MSDDPLMAQAREDALLEGIRMLLERAKEAEAELERVTAERDEALGLLDNERLYTAEHRGYALLAKDDLAAAEAEHDRLREALRQITKHDVRVPITGDPLKDDFCDWHCTAQMRDLARAALAGGTDAAPPEQKP